jgi:hypothetical protein
MNQGRALRELQAALHLRIDAIYAPLSPQVRAIIARHTHDGVLTVTDAELAIAELRRLFAIFDERAALVISRGLSAAEVLAASAAPNPATAWKAADQGDLIPTRHTLADGRRRAMGQVERVLRNAAATGRPAEDVATHLGQYADPWYATRRDPAGVLRRASRAQRLSGPALPGRVAVPARHLIMADIVDRHGQTSVNKAQRTPGALVLWDLAPWHDDADDCDENASRDTGHGPGLYDPRSVPRRSHFGCVCLMIFLPPVGDSR